jgi:hypothetical protein
VAQEVARLTTELAQERSAHDATRHKLAEARAAPGARSAFSPTAAAPGSPAAAVSRAAAPGTVGGRSSRKRQRTQADDDQEMQG